ncbi:hypothetical protein [Pseudomonas sp. 2848]|uniref:hypothetical protein n=1 Tax=Pseudomonas sp. 2848 TaxID=2183926 RepID=UPI001313F226|nr:hypothetical protein [Pseudomonas sp. 2848]
MALGSTLVLHFWITYQDAMEMQPQPQSVLAEIFEERQRIKNSLSESYILDELASERLKRRVSNELRDRSINDTHRAALHHELAAILGTQGRVDEACDHLGEAEKWGFEPIAVAFTMAFIYLSNGRVLDARSLIERVYKDVPENILGLVRAHQAQAGIVGVFMDMAETKPQYFVDSAEVARILASRGIADIELTKRLDTACRVIRSSIRLCTKSLDTCSCCVENSLGMLMYSSTLRFLGCFRLA